MASEIGEKELWTRYPITSGMEADEKHEGRVVNLVPEGINGLLSTIPVKDRVGI